MVISYIQYSVIFVLNFKSLIRDRGCKLVIARNLLCIYYKAMFYAFVPVK